MAGDGKTVRPRHVAIVMDGNGRWAVERGLPRSAGHRQGAIVVGHTVEAALALGIGTLTLYAFSSDNWRRPSTETLGLMALFDAYLRAEVGRCMASGIRLSVVGRRDRLAPTLRRRIEMAEARTSKGHRLHLRLAIDYSARDAIWLAAERLLASGNSSRADFAARVCSGRGEVTEAVDVDLLIRTGGEQRLSDFLLWESAYAELCFLQVRWPDFTPVHLADALRQFACRERRFGGVSPSQAVSV